MKFGSGRLACKVLWIFVLDNDLVVGVPVGGIFNIGVGFLLPLQFPSSLLNFSLKQTSGFDGLSSQCSHEIWIGAVVNLFR